MPGDHSPGVISSRKTCWTSSLLGEERRRSLEKSGIGSCRLPGDMRAPDGRDAAHGRAHQSREQGGAGRRRMRQGRQFPAFLAAGIGGLPRDALPGGPALGTAAAGAGPGGLATAHGARSTVRLRGHPLLQKRSEEAEHEDRDTDRFRPSVAAMADPQHLCQITISRGGKSVTATSARKGD